MSEIKEIVVGQTLLYVPSDSRNKPHSVTVTKVGRRWAETSQRLRFDITDLHVDGGQYSSPGRVYLDEDDWRRARERSAAWNEFRIAVSSAYTCPEHLSTEDIAALLATLTEKP